MLLETPHSPTESDTVAPILDGLIDKNTSKVESPKVFLEQRVLQKSPTNYPLLTAASAIRSLSITFAAAVIVATIFMWWTPSNFLSVQTRHSLALVQSTAVAVIASPTALPTPIWFNRIGIVAGHNGLATYGPTTGQTDPGTVCPDGFHESEVTLTTAKHVVALLQGRGFTVDLLEEFDLRLDNYRAAAFISLHADSCENFNDGYNHSGFKVTYPLEARSAHVRDVMLNDCVRDNYARVTALPFTPAGITVNMTHYHAFHAYREHPGIAPQTPAVIIELGLLSYDRDLLQNRTDKLAQGIVDGLLCFLNPGVPPTGSPATP